MQESQTHMDTGEEVAEARLYSPSSFIHLRVHSAYSLLEGAVRVKDLPRLCLAQDMPAVAVTDTGNLFGALEIAETLVKEGVQPITGCALAVRFDDAEGGQAANGAAHAAEIARVVLLVQDAAGYANLMKLSSRAFLESDGHDIAHVTLDLLQRHSGGLICLTGGAEGPVGRLLQAGRHDAAENLLRKFRAMFPDRLYVELQRHGLEAEIATEDHFVSLAYRNDLPLIATNDVYFPEREMYDAHDALICIAEGAYISQDDRRRLTAEHYFKSADEMSALFADLPEAIENTLEVAQRCAFRPQTRPPILPSYGNAQTAEQEAEELRRQAREGLRNRLRDEGMYAAEEDYYARLDYELGVISEMGFSGYFLIVADFIKWAKQRDIPVGPGRGSGAGSCVAWSLTITDLDPLRFGLLFERFLNPERVSMPDFDVDFCQDRRDEVIRYVQEKYGFDHVAQIIAVGKLQARAALRDVGRVLQMPYGQVDRLCKMVPNNPANPVSLSEAVASEEGLRAERDKEPIVERMLDIAMRIEGLYRHASVHAAGLVIGDRPLDELVPLYREPKSDMPVTQFHMKWVEPAGLVKFDFLGLKTLTVISRAVELLRRRGVAIDIAKIPLDDAPTFAMLQAAQVTGVFQLESTGMRNVLLQMRPDKFEDVIALVALYRPGPMDDIPKYNACKHGREEVVYPHPLLAPVLEETYGVIVYQEQVMEIARRLSGYSLGEADLLRRAMGKKIQSEMDAQRERFIQGALARDVDEATANHIFELVNKFAGYGFNKCHAAPYALIAYQTAYLKANYPVEFLAASMMLDQGNTDKLNIFRQEAQRSGIEIAPPDINRSNADFDVADGAVLYALGAIRNVGSQAMRGIVAERAKAGPFKDMRDFAARIGPNLLNRRGFEFLVKAGAFDSIHPNRAQLLAGADAVIALSAASENARTSNQSDLFGGVQEAGGQMILPDIDDFAPLERLREEYGALGFYMSAHPLDDYASLLAASGVVPSNEFLARLGGGERGARLAGTIVSKRERRSQRGNPYAFVMLADQAGEFEIAVFSDVLAQCRDLLEPGNLVTVSVTGRVEQDQVRLVAQSVKPVDKLTARANEGLRIFIDAPRPLDSIRQRLGEAGTGGGYVNLVMLIDGGSREVEMRLPGQYDVGPRARGAVKAVAGVVDVQEC